MTATANQNRGTYAARTHYAGDSYNRIYIVLEARV